MPAPKPLPTDSSLPSVVRRINELINDVHEGSVNAAARDCGIPQRTLARITEGALPRSDVLERVAQFYGASTDWLLSGKGEAPFLAPTREEPYPRAPEALQWRRIVDSLDLPANARNAVNLLSIVLADTALGCIVGFPGETDRVVHWTPAMLSATRTSRRAFVEMFQEWIRLFGVEVVRRVILENLDGVWRRFAYPPGDPMFVRPIPPERLQRLQAIDALKREPKAKRPK